MRGPSRSWRSAELLRMLDTESDVERARVRAGELVGRAIYTHELIFPELLVAEIMGEIERPDRAEILRRARAAMGPGKTVLAVDGETGDVEVIPT